MRARSGVVVGWIVVAAYAALLVGTAVDAVRHETVEPVASSTRSAEQFVTAWERSRSATFVTSGTYERRSPTTGARIASPDVVAQRPPRRVHRQLGGVEGRDDDRLLVCPASPERGGPPAACRLGDPGGPTYAESVIREVAALRMMLGGTDPIYTVRETEAGCFALDQIRVEPRAPFGVRAQFCFDPATGAPAGSRVEHDQGIVEVVDVTDIRTTVTPADLVP